MLLTKSLLKYARISTFWGPFFILRAKGRFPMCVWYDNEGRMASHYWIIWSCAHMQLTYSYLISHWRGNASFAPLRILVQRRKIKGQIISLFALSSLSHVMDVCSMSATLIKTFKSFTCLTTNFFVGYQP